MARSQPTRAMQDAMPDADLIRAVAEKRDQTAFAELYARHEQAANALARHMLRTSDAAEVAVQEAMLRVWRSAGKYRYDKSARGWLLRIVAFECIRIQKVRRAETLRHKPLHGDAAEAAGAARVRAEKASREEQLDGLRRCLERLPEAGRQLVSLYYLGGLTQEEIGRELAISQQAVSSRLRDALKFLRSELSQIGLAAALPLLNENALGAALGETYPAPAALKAGVLEALARPCAEASAQALRAFSRKVAVSSFPWPSVLTVAVVAAVAIVSYVAFAPASAPKSADRAMTEPAPASETLNAVSEDAPLRTITWTFEQGQPEGFKLLKGRWLDVAKDHLHLAGVVAYRGRKDAVTTLLPVQVRARPFRMRSVLFYVRENANLDRTGDGKGRVQGGISFGYTDGKGDVGLLDWYTQPRQGDWDLDKPHVLQSDHYFIGRYIFHILEGKLTSVKVNDQPYPARQIYLSAFGHGIHSIEFQEIEVDEIPELLRDPGALVAEVKAKRDAHQDEWRRFLSVGLPEP